MKTWYGRLVQKVSYRIDNNAVANYLSKTPDYIELSRQDSTPELDHLLHILENTECKENTPWIEQYTTEKKGWGKFCYKLLLSQESLNHIRYVNKYLIRQNRILEYGGHLVCWFQPSVIRKLLIFKKYPSIIAYPVYFSDFFWHRICPKLPWVKKLYFAITHGKNRVYPRPEIFGRLYCCGFKIVSSRYINNNHYVVAEKIREPFDDPYPSYGPIIRLRRVGYQGKRFNVYKFRTMHAYSEYLQSYIYEQNHLSNGGKFANDYRIPHWGSFLRKYWLDEIPMIINLLKGNVKLVGVRPLSEQYYNLYSLELQRLRIRTKPGIFPPYYADIPKTLEEIEASETRYLESYLQHPWATDWKYFWKIAYHILFKGKRSA